MSTNEPRLYGIYHSNRHDHWGKNQFNSSFPVSLACYMRDHNINAVYLSLNENLEVTSSEISLDEVFNTGVPNPQLTFDFESVFTPYTCYAYDDIKNIDLVIKHNDQYLRALEVKLTVIPDETTHNKPENEWGSEIVIRPVTTSYSALGIAHSCRDSYRRVAQILEPAWRDIRHWGSEQEILANREHILNALDNFQREFYTRQQPFVLQPIWKTRGKESVLNEHHAFDIFVWSDFALCRAFLDSARSGRQADNRRVSRYMRASARLLRILYDIATRGRANLQEIYTEMALGHQTDKEFALSGRITHRYMRSERLTNPALPMRVLRDIILNGGYRRLSPERRFDQTVYFTAAHLFESEDSD